MRIRVKYVSAHIAPDKERCSECGKAGGKEPYEQVFDNVDTFFTDEGNDKGLLFVDLDGDMPTFTISRQYRVEQGVDEVTLVKAED